MIEKKTPLMLAVFLLLSAFPDAVAMEIGICDQLTRDNFGLGWDARELESNIRAAESAGIKHLRTDFYWDLIEPTQGNWNWAPFDKVIAVAAEHGITILPIVSHQNAAYGNPIVTNPVGGEDWHNLVTWSNFVSQVMARYRGRIEAVEIWNEQNIEQFWQSPNVGNYCKLLKASYAAVKAVDPNILVVMGGLAGRQDGYFKTLCTDAKDWFDVVAFHPYRTIHEPDWKQNSWDEFLGKDLCPGSNGMVDEYLRVMSDNGVTQPVWITEIGWPTHKDGVSESDQADYLVRFFRHCEGKGNIERVFVYECRAAEWAADERPEPVAEANFGILHKNYQPKPAYAAVRDYIVSKTAFQDPSDGRLYLTIGDDNTEFSSFQHSYNWLDTGTAEADRHYLVDLGDTKCIRTADLWQESQTFGGASLTLGRVGGPSARFVNRGWGDTFACNDLRLANGRLLAEGKWGFANQVWNGHATILSPAEAPFLIQSAAGEIRHHEWSMSLSGAAGTAIRFAGADAGLVVTLKGDASDYYGKYIVDLEHTRLELTAAALAGTGSMLPDGILIRNNAEITPATAGLELASQRRGVTVESTGGRLLVDKDCAFSLPLEGTLTKTGDATLVFGTSSGRGRLDVTSGTVEVKPEAAGRLGRITGGMIRVWSENGAYGSITLSGATIDGGTFVLDCDGKTDASDAIALDRTCKVTWPINILLSGANLPLGRTYPLVSVAKELKDVTADDFNVTADVADGQDVRLCIDESGNAKTFAVIVGYPIHADTFEEVSVGTTSLAGWTGAGVVIAGQPTVNDPPGFPVRNATHKQVYSCDDSVRTYEFATPTGNQTIDWLCKVEYVDEGTLAKLLDVKGQEQFMLAVDGEGFLRLLHTDERGAAVWSRLDGLGRHQEGEWLRLSAYIDYKSVAGAAFVQVRENGSVCTSSDGFRSPTDLRSPGSWFRCLPAAGTNKCVSRLRFKGDGEIDDLVLAGTPSAATDAFNFGTATEIGGIPLSWFDAYGIPRDPNGDPDGDGFANKVEWEKGTNPADRRSHPPRGLIIIFN